jgi:glycosyltransferase involved in cell wall biosynthesis
MIQHLKGLVAQLNSASYEIVFVDDGSDDKTLPLLLQEAESTPNLSVISNSSNMGKGYAVRRGVLQSKGNIVIFMDGDTEVSPFAISEFIHAVKDFDLVIGSKTHPLSSTISPIYRKIESRAFNLIVRSIFGMNTRDTQTGLKCGRGEVLRDIFNIMSVNRYAFDVELLAIAHFLNLRVKELPVKIRYTGNLKAIEILRMLLDLTKILYNTKLKRSYKNQLKLIRDKRYLIA